MPFVTVLGASSQPFALNVADHRAVTLGNQFQNAIVNFRSEPSPLNATVGGAEQSGLNALSASSLPRTVASTDQNLFGNGAADSHLQAGGIHPASVSGALGDTISAGGDLHLTQSVAQQTNLSFIGGNGTVSGGGQASLFGANGQVSQYLAQQSAARNQAVNRFDTLHGAAHDTVSTLPQAASSHSVLNAWTHAQQAAQKGSVPGAVNGDTTQGGQHTAQPQASSSKDLLHFLDSSQAQNATLKNFGSAAGNMVGTNAQQLQGNAQSAMSSVLGGSTLNNLQNQQNKSQITFMDDHYAQQHSNLFKPH